MYGWPQGHAAVLKKWQADDIVCVCHCDRAVGLRLPYATTIGIASFPSPLAMKIQPKHPCDESLKRAGMRNDKKYQFLRKQSDNLSDMTKI
jgi:hypothetical protein